MISVDDKPYLGEAVCRACSHSWMVFSPTGGVNEGERIWCPHCGAIEGALE